MLAPAASSSFNPGCRPLLLVLMLALIPSAGGSAGLNFTLPGLDGRPVRLADFHGQWVIVNFWASWCAPCLLEMPELESFHQTQHDRAVVIGVNFEDLALGEIRSFVKRLGVTFPIVLSAGQPMPGFPLKGLPTTFLISPSGTLAHTHLGAVNAALLAERLTELERTGGWPGPKAATSSHPQP
ncbi:MAG: TlpA disulfide reductase family protein [Candidatus Contendobacter sp.]|nr:TlpA disulfide reductase family protein [Candidatus Contendobacter sp.]MDS4059865.1 TlpA disulfide reductase family protein [Candidatus Contendobacter sp.]